MSKRSVLVLWFASLPLLAAHWQPVPAAGPELLTFDELVTLSETDRPAAPLDEKLDRLLSTPFLNNDAARAGIQPHRPLLVGLGPVVRVASWNIERGLEFDLIRLAFSDPDGFMQSVQQRAVLDVNRQLQIEKQLISLREADIIILNEVDLGMKRASNSNLAAFVAQWGNGNVGNQIILGIGGGFDSVPAGLIMNFASFGLAAPPFSSAQWESTVLVHEVLHTYTGDDDPTLAKALGWGGSGDPSQWISAFLLRDCQK
jgi:hypothetical protein